MSARDIFVSNVRDLAQTCRALRAETTKVFWGHNHFRFDLRDHELFCECLRFAKLASTEILSSLRKFDFAPTYWQPVNAELPGLTFLIDREREQMRVIREEGYSDIHDSWRDEYFKQIIRAIKAIRPYAKGEPLRGKRLEQLLKLMSPKTFQYIARAKGIGR